MKRKTDKADSFVKIKCPDAKTYKDIHSQTSIPSVKKKDVRDYLPYPSKKFLIAGKRLYDSHWLIYLRHAKDNNGFHYIRGNVRAEMKKTSYEVDIKMKDNGVICKAQCECPAGAPGENGAHCKHITCILNALMDFTETNTLKREMACTSVLQTFKRPSKLHDGSPVKAHDLKIGRTVKETMFDPRPVELKNQPGYANRVFNMAVNYGFSPKPPILQLINPANRAAHDLDHTYSSIDPVKHFLKKENLSQISQAKASKIEQLTRKQDASISKMKT